MIKRTIFKTFTPILLVCLFYLGACSSGNGDIHYSTLSKISQHQEVAVAFAENVAKGKIKEAKKYATEASGAMIDMTAQMGGLKIIPDASYSIMRDSISGKKGFVQLKDNNSKKVRGEWFAVVMVDDEWKVDLNRTVKRQQRLNAQKRKTKR